MRIKGRIYRFLKWIKKDTRTEMIYFVKGGSWLIFGKVCGILFSLAIMTTFAHFTSKETFGAYQYILSIAAILEIFSLPGIDIALIRSVARGFEGMVFPCVKEKIKWGLISSLISFSLSIWYFFRQNLNLAFSFLIVAVFLPFIKAFYIYLSFWQGKKRFDIQNKYFIFHNLLGTSILILTIFLTKNLIFIVLAFYFGFALAEGVFFKKTIKKISNQSKEKETISFGKHLTLIQSPIRFSNQIDKIILWQILGPIPVAIFSFAQKPIQKIQQLIPFSSLALPKLSQENIKKIKKRVFKNFLKLFFISIPLTLIYFLICPSLYKIFFPVYTDSIRYSQILALILVFSPFSLLRTAFWAEMKKRELYILNFTTPLLKTILFLVLIPLYGIWGVIFSFLIAGIFRSLLTFYFFKKI